MLHFLCWNQNPQVVRWCVGAIAVCCVLLCSGCWREIEVASPQSFHRPAERPIDVVVTVGMVGDLVRAVGGDEVVVHQMLGAGVDPHLYKASRDDVRMVMQADLVFYSGLMLEGKLFSVLEKVGRTRPVFAVTQGIPANQLLGEAESHGHHDPHVWMDPNLWGQAADEVARVLSELDPENAPKYQANLSEYRKQLDALDTYARQAIESIPREQRVFVTSHDAFQYFGRAFDIEVQGIQGISTESEAGLLDVNRLVDLLVERKVPTVFFESSVPARSIEALVAGVEARGHHIEIRGPMYSDAMGSAGTYEGTYIGMIDHNVTLIAMGLGGSVSPGGMNGRLSLIEHGE
ncbi:MAG: zinc ABC transporter substrate-binding protein [Pirellulaceae bacterium]